MQHPTACIICMKKAKNRYLSIRVKYEVGGRVDEAVNFTASKVSMHVER